MCPTGTALLPSVDPLDLRSAFDVLDADHDGKISRDDLRTFCGVFPGAVDGLFSEKEDVIGSMISVADSNRDGFVEYVEFENVLDGKKDGEREWGLMKDAFKAMDRDGDGKVGHEDLKSFLSSAGFDVTDDDIKAMIEIGGDNGNGEGGVTFDGLLRILSF